MAIKTDVELLAQVAAGIVVNGNGEITPTIHKAIEDNIIDSKLSKKDGGNVIEALTGYTTDLTPSDDKHLTPKKFVTDLVATKQDTLVSGTNIKTVNGTSLLGSGNVAISTTVADGDYGDVVVSGTGTVITIATGVVTNAKLAGAIQASKLIGTDISTVGTITAGIWNGTIIAGQYGGTGVANTGKTITVSGNLQTTGAFDLTIAVPRTTTYTLPNTASETLAGLGTIQTFTAKQTFTAATTEITALTLLDTTYKTALDVSVTALRVGNGFASLALAPTSIGLVANVVFQAAGTASWNSSGTTAMQFNCNGSNPVIISRTIAATSAAAALVDLQVGFSGSYAPATPNVTGSFTSILCKPVINMTGTSAQDVTIIDVNPTATSVRGNFYGLRSRIAAAPTGGGTAWNIYADGTAANYFGGDITIQDKNLIFGTTTGTKIGTATGQKIGFWNTTPIVQPTTAITGETITANSGTAVNDASTFGGYTIGQVVKALRTAGLLA